MTTAAAPQCHADGTAATALTLEQLSIAYRERYTPAWPPTLEEALAKKPFRIALEQVAKNRNRPALVPWQPHSLPRLPAPPTPGVRELTGPLKHGRSVYSIAQGPMVELSVWPKRPPSKKKSTGATAAPRFDAKKAAANDLDN